MQKIHLQSCVWGTQLTGKIFPEAEIRKYICLELGSLSSFLFPPSFPPFCYKKWSQFISKVTTAKSPDDTPRPLLVGRGCWLSLGFRVSRQLAQWRTPSGIHCYPPPPKPSVGSPCQCAFSVGSAVKGPDGSLSFSTAI